MNDHPSRDPRIRALAELLHQIRPTWDRAGIRSALLTAATSNTFEQVTFGALVAAFDTSANTPGVIPHRVGAATFASAGAKSDAPTKLPPSVAAVLPTSDAGDYAAGVAAARAAIQAAKDAAYAAPKPTPENATQSPL